MQIVIINIKQKRGLRTILLPELSRLDKFLWKIKGYKVTKLQEDPEQ
jgi:hypothetical protein